jgi:uncharacterized membrane protein YhaH (DUF805 family)
MINIGLHPTLSFVCGIPFIALYCWMLTDRISSRIRRSRYWPVGWLGALMILSTGGKLMLPVLNGLPIDDNVAVPVLFGLVMLAILVLSVNNIYQLRKLRQG